MPVNIGPKIGIDGEKEYRSEINRIIQQAKTLDAEMKKVTASFGANSTAQEKNAATSKVLTAQIENQRERVEMLTRMLDEAQKAWGANDTKTQKWQQAVYEATAELYKLESALEDATGETEELGESLDSAGKDAADFGDILKASILSDAIMRGFDLLTDKAKEFAEGMVTSAAEVRAELSQYEQAFGDYIGKADAIIGEIADDANIVETRLRKTASGIYAFARSSGADAPEALELMEDALGVTADTAAYYDRSLEDAAETLQSFLKGNYENDAALGVSATEFTRNQKAVEKFGKEFNDLTEIQKQQTLLQMVKDAQELSGAMGQAAREADGWVNVQGNLNETVRQLQARAGAQLLDRLIPRIKDITADLQALEGKVDWDRLGQGIDAVLGFIDRNADNIADGIIKIGASFAAFKSVGLIAEATQKINGLISAGKMLLASNPYTALAAGIGVAVAAIGAYVSWMTEETEAQKVARETTQALAESVEDLSKSYEEAKEQSLKTAEADLSQVKRTQELAQELRELADADGNVLQRNRDRAQFIVAELNEAMGTEYRLIGDQIEGYKNLQEEVKKTIKAKKLEILSTQLEEDYTTAIKARQEAEENLAEVERKVVEARENYLKAEAEALQYRGKVGTKEHFQLIQQMEAQREQVLILEQAQLQARDTWIKVTGDIGKYEEIRTLIFSGQTDKAIAKMEEWNDAYAKVAAASYQSADEQKAAYASLLLSLERQYDIYKSEFKKGTAGFTREGLKELETQVEQVKIKAEMLGSELANGYIRGLRAREKAMTETTRDVFSKVSGIPKQVLLIKSPSRITMEDGRYFGLGFEISAVEALKHAGQEIKKQFDGISGMTVPSVEMPSTATAYNNSYNYGGVNIHVHAAAGQSAQQIAEEVEHRVQRAITNKEAVWA